MDDAYFDLDDVLTTEKRVPCTFAVKAAGLGYLVPGAELTEEDELPAKTMVELPLWLAQPLFEKHMATIALPKFFGGRCKSRLKASAWTVRLRDKSPSYYTLGLHLGVLLKDTSMAPELRRAFAARFGHILDRALNSLNEDNSEFLRNLTDLERDVFSVGFASALAYAHWNNGFGAGMLKASSVAKLGQKRKRSSR